MKLTLPLLAAALVAGCATSAAPPTTSRMDSCIDATDDIRGFQRVDDRTVHVRVSPGRRYAIELAADCPHLGRAESVSVSNGIPRLIGHRHGRPLWANTVEGSGWVCGGAGDRLMVRQPFYDFDRPMDSCPIRAVRRLP